jgi:hypothetical protein
LGPDTESLRRIDEMRTAFERLRTERIRAESEVERLERDLDAARAEARRHFGTDDEGEIERMIQSTRAENTRLVDEFEALLRDIAARLDRLGEES